MAKRSEAKIKSLIDEMSPEQIAKAITGVLESGKITEQIWKDLRKSLDRIGDRLGLDVVAGLLASITGYTVSRWIGGRERLLSDLPGLIEMLEDEENEKWKPKGKA